MTSIGGSLAYHQVLALDVTSQTSVDQAVGSLAKDTGGRLDVLVNNVSRTRPKRKTTLTQQAATWARHTTLDIDIDAVKAMFDTNVFGPIRVIQACAPLLLSSKTDKKPMVVNIGSTTGSAPSPWQASYASTKVRASDGLVRGGLTPRRHSTYSQTLFVSRRED